MPPHDDFEHTLTAVCEGVRKQLPSNTGFVLLVMQEGPTPSESLVAMRTNLKQEIAAALCLDSGKRLSEEVPDFHIPFGSEA